MNINASQFPLPLRLQCWNSGKTVRVHTVLTFHVGWAKSQKKKKRKKVKWKKKKKENKNTSLSHENETKKVEWKTNKWTIETNNIKQNELNKTSDLNQRPLFFNFLCLLSQFQRNLLLLLLLLVSSSYYCLVVVIVFRFTENLPSIWLQRKQFWPQRMGQVCSHWKWV